MVRPAGIAGQCPDVDYRLVERTVQAECQTRRTAFHQPGRFFVRYRSQDSPERRGRTTGEMTKVAIQGSLFRRR